MLINDKSRIINVHGLTDEQKKSIMDFLQGAVYCWCKNRKGEWFSMRELMGGDNYYWQGTPLIALYEKHEDEVDDPVKVAGQDSGKLLKAVLKKDKRKFEVKEEAMIKQYRWIPSKKEY